MATPLPKVGLYRDKYGKGLARLGDEVPPLAVHPLNQALDTRWDTDAHFVTYRVVKAGEELPAWPRLKKVVLGPLEEAGARVETTMIVLDYDNDKALPADVVAANRAPDGKVPWTDELIEDFWRRVDDAVEGGDLPLPNVIYTTKNGARLVYVLEEPIDVRESEDYIRGMVHAWGEAGVALDPLCDWTRMFRLPQVNRDGRKTWESPYFRIVDQWEELLPRDAVEPIEKSRDGEYAELHEITDPRPEHDECLRMLEVQNPSGGTARSTAIFKEAKKRLYGRGCYSCLFDYAPVADQGSRDQTLTKYVGEAVGVLYHLDAATPAFAYALFLPAVEQLEPDDGTPNWLDKLWYLVRYAWAREDAKHRAQEEKTEREVERQQTALGGMLARYRSWCDHTGVEGDEDQAALWMLEHSIAMSNGRKYYILQPNGHYSRNGVPRDHVGVAIREAGLDEFIQTTYVTKDGDERNLPVQDLLANYGTQVHAVRGAANLKGTIISGIGGPDATLWLDLYHHKPGLEPCYSEDVDQWLTKLVGEDRVQDLRNWIGMALDFEAGPICALSLAGPPAAGKKMLVRGLAECINTEAVATGLDIVQTHAHTLLRTPFLCVDEGLPSARGVADVADQFRRMVSGEELTVNVKYGDMVYIRSPLRVIFTANDMDVVRSLTAHRDLVPEAQAALAERIYHMDCRRAAADWLSVRGGLRYTKGWIAGDGGQKSNYTVARHFLWLFENRPAEPLGKRLLMEGNLGGKVMRDMRTQSGVAPFVIRTVVGMIEACATNHNISGVSVDGEQGRAYVTTNGVLEHHRSDMANKRELSAKQVGTVLRSLVVAGSPESPTTKVSPNGTRLRARWHDLNLVLLFEEAQLNGYRSDRIEELLRAQYGSEADSLIASVLESL